ncbi:MAG: Penicillin-binding protein 4 [Verrucomicrobiales bacterium]|nr:Penicillin-binding protein 4 [Verrucomicrobiales bacterium]
MLRTFGALEIFLEQLPDRITSSVITNSRQIMLAVICLVQIASTTAMCQLNERAIDELFRDFFGNHPGASVMVIHDGKPVFAKAYGMADVDNKVPCTTNTNFRLASVTKQFTAMGILILADRNKLSLDDKITKFFPRFPKYGEQTTVRHLLTHTSGVYDYDDPVPPGTTVQMKDKDVLKTVAGHDETYFPPGTKFRYSNSGYALLALIIEKVSGQSYADFLKANVFTPLGMSNSVAFEDGISTVPNRAFGYAKNGDHFEPADQSLTSAVLGDGGIYSSVVDMFKWDQSLYTDKLVSHARLKDAFTVHSKTSDMAGSGYGYGWYVAGPDHVWHYGSTCGFNTMINRFPQKKTTIIILTNRADAKLTELTSKLVDVVMGAKL